MIDNKNLLIPIVNLDGIVRSVQFIKPNGTKIFLKDGEKHGNFTIIDDKNTKTALKNRDYPQIIIAEVRTPNFGKSELIQGLTDYNDYAKSRGIPALAQEFNGNFYEKKSEIVLK